MTRSTSLWIFVLALTLLTRLPEALASNEEDHLISVGGGISSPSATSAIGENPAGLVYNQSPKLLLDAATANDQLKPIGLGAGLFAGNGTVGAGVTIQGINDNPVMVNVGLAADITPFNAAIGVTGRRGTSSGSGWDFDTGVIFNPRGQGRWGLTAYSVQNQVDAWGLGFAFDAGSSATLVLDGAYTPGTKTAVAKPSLGIHLASLQLSAGYGVNVAGQGGSQIPEGFSLAVGIPIQRSYALQFYYNQISHYYAGLTVHLN